MKLKENSKVELKNMLWKYFQRPKLITVIKGSVTAVVTEKCSSTL